MNMKRIAVCCYILSVCFFVLTFACKEISQEAKGVEVSTGYMDSNGQFVNNGYSFTMGGNAQVERNFATGAKICPVCGVVFLLIGTACLINGGSNTNSNNRSYYMQDVRWVYGDTSKPQSGWRCSECGAKNAAYIGTCACGAQKPPL